MAYDRYENRRGWREGRPRFVADFEEREDRGFFERAGDEVASWFGDEEAERRRREDVQFGRPDEDRFSRRPSAFLSDEEFSRFDRSPRFRDEGPRRPYTGRFQGRRSFGPDDDRWTPDRQREFSHREFSGVAYGLHDPHYSEWRRRQLDELDRDYDDYRRENQSRFESDFANWRSARQGKRQLLGQVLEHMEVVGSDEEHLGTVDKIRGDNIVLTKSDSPDAQHHLFSCSLIDRIEGDRLILDRPAAEARKQLLTEVRGGALFERDEEREPGPHMLNRSFSGPYER